METVRNLDMTPPAPSGRADAFLKAVRHTLWDFLTGKNSFRSFQDRYRFNIIRWSASHFRTPSLMERAILLLRTDNPLKTAYEDFQRKYAHLLGRWEMEAVRKVNLTLIELGRTPFYPHKRNIDRMLDDVYKGIKKLQGYKGCPDMKNERLLLATYRYMFAAPSDSRYGTLCPDELCGMLEQHGVDRRELCRQNYGGLFRDGTTALYETETDGNGNRYLRPSGAKSYGMEYARSTEYNTKREGTGCKPFRYGAFEKGGKGVQAIKEEKNRTKKDRIGKNQIIKP